jgi:selenocysteine lyase/cysteine desulfurase
MSIIPSQRHLFDIPDDVCYLNCAYMSPLMKPVTEAGHEAVEVKAQPWKVASSDFFTSTERARGLFAELIGATADDIAIVPSCSYGIATAAANLPVATGSRIIVLEEQFPSNLYSWRDVAVRAGGDVVTVRRGGNDGWTPRILDAIDSNTAIVALPHCHWTDGSLVDLVAVGARCRETGAALVIDLTQSIGALPFEIEAVKPDFMVAAGYKWMMGPYSLGFLYVAPKWQGGQPLEQNWMARAGSQNFAGLVDYQDGYQPGARRFDVGEVANFALLPMAMAAIEKLLEWGVDNIQETISQLTMTVTTEAGQLGLNADDPSMRAGHFLGLGFSGGKVPAGLPERLAAENVYVSVRGPAMRVTPHLYNDENDIDRLMEALKRSL